MALLQQTQTAIQREDAKVGRSLNLALRNLLMRALPCRHTTLLQLTRGTKLVKTINARRIGLNEQLARASPLLPCERRFEMAQLQLPLVLVFKGLNMKHGPWRKTYLKARDCILLFLCAACFMKGLFAIIPYCMGLGSRISNRQVYGCMSNVQPSNPVVSRIL
jgi:hypothetical protein